MRIYYVSLYGGYCGLLAARSLRSATSRALREHGSRNLQCVRPAAKRDIEDVSSMGGYVPPGRTDSGRR